MDHIMVSYNLNSRWLPKFELGICSLHKNGVEFDKDFHGDPQVVLVVGIPTKNGQSKKEQISH